MFKHDVLGWRILAVFFTVMVFFSVTEYDYLEDEWKESIEGEPYENVEDNSPEEVVEPEQKSEPEQESEPAMATSSDSGDDESADGAESPPESLDFEYTETSPSPNQNPNSEWILPATQVIVLTVMSLMAVSLLASTSIALITSEAARFSILIAILGPIIAITQRGETGAFTRGRILGYIEAHPGIHFSAIRDALSLGNGVTSHHIQILEKEGRIISWIDGKVRRFASSGVDQDRLDDIREPVVGMQIAILQILSENNELGIKSSDLRIKLATSRQLLSYHMKQLSERNFVQSEGKGKAIRWSILEKGITQLQNSKHLSLSSLE